MNGEIAAVVLLNSKPLWSSQRPELVLLFAESFYALLAITACQVKVVPSSKGMQTAKQRM